MRTLPTSRADLEHKRTIFFEIGLIIALAAILVSFEIKSFKGPEIDLNTLMIDRDQEELGEITTQKPPELPPPKTDQQTTLIEIVENEMEVEDELEVNVEADQETRIETYVPFNPVDMQEEEEEAEEPVFVVVESMPEFPGGESARLKYLSENLDYPVIAREAGIEGIVYVTFVVEKNGEITSVEILRGIGGGCDEEALRVVENMPRWVPGKQRNIPVRVQFNMPIRFILL
jgi:protein TonB